MKNEKAIGIDLGGTNIRGVFVNKEGKIIQQLKYKSRTEKGKEFTIKRIMETVRKLMVQSGNSLEDLKGIGMGAPGPLDIKKGIIHFAPNLPGWKDVPLKRIFEDEFKTKVILENDANAAAWGEKTFGVGKGTKNLVCFTLGTGIGGGIIVDGKIYHGNNFVAAELGHMTVNKNGPCCNCGNYGCLESYSSATGIRNRIKERTRKGIKSDLLSIKDEFSVDSITLKSIFESARMGDKLTESVIEDAITYLGIAVANIANILNPEMIVLVGGITNEGDKLLNPIKKEVLKRTLSSNHQELKIAIGKLGDLAGALGAAALVF